MSGLLTSQRLHDIRRFTIGTGEWRLDWVEELFGHIGALEKELNIANTSALYQQLRAEHLREALERIGNERWDRDSYGVFCQACGEHKRLHYDWCPILIAREALRKGET